MNTLQTELSESTFRFFRDLVEEHSAISLDRSKQYLLNARLSPLARCNGLSSLDELAGRLRMNAFGALHQQVIEAMTTNETSFFRDGRPFDALREHLIPQALERRRDGQPLRIWSAACATGQEPYSVAILLKEHFPELRSNEVEITASDISETALQRAQQAEYTGFEIARGLTSALRDKYFTPQGKAWKARPVIRNLVTFHKSNLIGSWSVQGPFDIILLRNVLIYFGDAARVKVFTKLREKIAADGVLMLGASEYSLNAIPKWRRETCGSVLVLRPE